MRPHIQIGRWDQEANRRVWRSASRRQVLSSIGSFIAGVVASVIAHEVFLDGSNNEAEASRPGNIGLLAIQAGAEVTAIAGSTLQDIESSFIDREVRVIYSWIDLLKALDSLPSRLSYAFRPSSFQPGTEVVVLATLGAIPIGNNGESLRAVDISAREDHGVIELRPSELLFSHGPKLQNDPVVPYAPFILARFPRCDLNGIELPYQVLPFETRPLLPIR